MAKIPTTAPRSDAGLASWNRINAYLADRKTFGLESKLGAIHYIEQMTDDHEFRYEQRGEEYTLRSWHNGIEKSHRGFIDNTPGWLRDILVTAKVAGAIRPIATPPPEVILWFRTDNSHNLTEFIEMQ